MYLYLVRHGSAVLHGTEGITCDAERTLTPKGIKKLRASASALVQLGVTLDEVWTSPLTRARETADVLIDEFAVAQPARVVDYLQPEAPFEPLAEELQNHLEQAGIALVGHEPDLGELATYLLTGTRSASFRFKKGGVACIEVYDIRPQVHCQLRWLLTPKQMLAITD